MAVLNSLILKLLSSETRPEPAGQQDDGDLFLDTSHVPAQNIDKEQVASLDLYVWFQFKEIS